MKQFNVNITKEFEKSLGLYMKLTGIKVKAEAIRQAIDEAVRIRSKATQPGNFQELLGIGLKAAISKKKVLTEDELWS